MFRLQQKSSGKFFVMGESSVVPMDRQSSLFNKQDDYLTSKSYSFELPLNETNKAIIRNAHHINTSNAGRTDQVIAWDAYRPLQEARMVFTIKGKVITGELYFDGGPVISDLKNKKLTDIGIGDNDDQISFDNGAALLAFMNSSVEGDQKTKNVIFFPVKNDNAYNVIPEDQQATYPDIEFPVNNYMNAWQIDLGTGTGTFKMDTVSGSNRESQLPYFKIVYLLKRVIKYLGYKPGGTWFDDEDANRIVIHSNIALPGVFLVPDISFHMPAITLGAFIKEMRTRIGLNINFNDNTGICEVNSIKYVRTNGKIVDLRGQQLADTYEETGAAPDAYIISQSIDSKDKAFEGVDESTLQQLIIGDVSGAINVQEIPLLSAVTKMYSGIGPQGSYWRVPEIQQPIYPRTPLDQISALAYSDRSDFKIRLLYYHGMVANGAGYMYPYASVDNLDKDGARLTLYSLSLDITGLTYSSMLELHAYIRNSKPFFMGFTMTVQQYFEIEASNRLLVKDPFDFSTVVCLFDVMSADLDNRNLVNVKITLYPDILPDNVSAPVVDPEAPVILPPDPPVDNGVVYAKLIIRNYNTIESSYPPPFYNRTTGDVVLQFFENAAGTVPKNVTGLNVGVKTTYGSGGSSSTYVNNYHCTTTAFETVVQPNAAMHTNAGGTSTSWSYEIEPGATYTKI